MIQDISPKKFDNQYRNILPEPGDTALVYNKGKVLMKELPDGTIAYPPGVTSAHRKSRAPTYFRLMKKNFFWHSGWTFRCRKDLN